MSMNATRSVTRDGARRPLLAKAVAVALAITSFAAVQGDALAGEREQAKRMYDRLTGTPPSPALLDTLTQRVQNGGLVDTGRHLHGVERPETLCLGRQQ